MVNKAVLWGLAAYLAAAAGAGAAPVPGEQAQAAGDRQEISYDKWLAAKTSAEKLAAEGKKFPKCYLACGKKDFLYEANRKFRDRLIALGCEVTWDETEEHGHE